MLPRGGTHFSTMQTVQPSFLRYARLLWQGLEAIVWMFLRVRVNEFADFFDIFRILAQPLLHTSGRRNNHRHVSDWLVAAGPAKKEFAIAAIHAEASGLGIFDW